MPCDCLEKINAALKPHHLMVDISPAWWGGDSPTLVSLTKLHTAPKQMKVHVLRAKFCPFCGVEYAPMVTMEEANKRARARRAQDGATAPPDDTVVSEHHPAQESSPVVSEGE
jgi:hypothetical protein